MVRSSLSERINVLFWDHENMRRRLRSQVVEGDADVVLMNLGRGDGSIDDLTEDAVLNGHSPIRKLNHSPARAGKSSSFSIYGRIRKTFDVRTDRPQLADDGLVAAIDMVNAVDKGFTLSSEGGQD